MTRDDVSLALKESTRYPGPTFAEALVRRGADPSVAARASAAGLAKEGTEACIDAASAVLNGEPPELLRQVVQYDNDYGVGYIVPDADYAEACELIQSGLLEDVGETGLKVKPTEEGRQLVEGG